MNQTTKIVFEEATKTLTKSNGDEWITITAVIAVVALAFWLSFKKEKIKEVSVR
jgi:hypothetical protein